MKSHLELNSLILKFFCYVTWFDERQHLETLQTRPICESLMFLRNKKKNIPPMKLLIRFPNPCSSLNDWLGRQRCLFTIHLAMELKLSIQSLLNLKTLKWSFRTAKSLLWKSRKSNPVLGFYEGVLIKMIIWA